jgi:hypothetical protein
MKASVSIRYIAVICSGRVLSGRNRSWRTVEGATWPPAAFARLGPSANTSSECGGRLDRSSISAKLSSDNFDLDETAKIAGDAEEPPVDGVHDAIGRRRSQRPSFQPPGQPICERSKRTISQKVQFRKFLSESPTVSHKNNPRQGAIGST